MNLHRTIINEGYGENLVVLTLDEIIRAGKVTNPYQNFVLCWLSEQFRNGITPASPGLRPPGTLGATSTAVVESIKALSPEEAVKLAQFLKDCVLQSQTMPWGANLSANEWINLVVRKSDD